ncbi:MAG: HipA domain-containing protein [Aeromicrobium sp.]|uniref:HipA domain-containing protein n=1 Tax=Aeromicrobium sp. TaxID=1871063 RepID=UPI0039E6C46B
MTDELAVYLLGRHTGTLTRGPRGRLSFEYTPQAADDGLELSPRLPTGHAASSRAITSFVAGLLPERPEVRERWAHDLGTTTSDFDLLTHMGLDCPGAVQFIAPERSDELERPETYAPMSETAFDDRLTELADGEPEWTLPGEHWSLDGYQDKFAVARLDGQWLTATGSAATTHIVKPGIRRMRGQALVEHVTMRAAARCGLAVARTEYVEPGGVGGIVVERFDRVVTADGVRRWHQVDLCQALGVMPSSKYEQDGGPSAADIATLLRPADVRRLSDALIFNYLSGSNDGHAKNYALLYAAGQRRLTPLYDVASGLPYGAEAAERTVAMSIGGQRRLGSVGRAEWERHARQLHLDPTERVDRVRHLAERLLEAFEAAFDEVAGSLEAATIRSRLLPRLEQHLGDTLRAVG